MDLLPESIWSAIPEDAQPAVERWWASLADSERRETAELWDKRREVYFFTPQMDESGRVDRWTQVPAVEGGRFVPHDDSVRMAEWLEDWQEYLQGHEEVILLPRTILLIRTFHICQVEPAARAVTEKGLLPAWFVCPVEAETCPMRRVQVAVPGQDVSLSRAKSGGWWVVATWGKLERQCR